MREAITKLLGRSIFLKFTMAFIAVGLIPLLFFSYIALAAFSNNIQRTNIENMGRLLDYASRSLDKMIVNYNKITKIMYTYNVSGAGSFGDILRCSKSNDRRLAMESAFLIDDFVKYILEANINIQDVLFVDEDLRVYEASFYSSGFNYNYNFAPLIKKVRTNSSKLTIIPPRLPEYYRNPEDMVITFGRNYDMSQYEIRNASGVILIDVKLDVFTELFEQIFLGEHGAIYLVDCDGESIFGYSQSNVLDKFTLDKEIGALLRTKRQNFTIRPHDIYYIVRYVPMADWMVIGKVDQQDLVKELTRYRSIIGVLMAFFICFLIVISVIFSNSFSIPVQRIIKQMKEVEKGNLNVRVITTTQDEIGQIANNFNGMVQELRTYINKSYIAQIKQKEAELSALRAQIRPHYLYNILEIIRMSALENDDGEVADLIHSLSVQLRYMINESSDLISLHQELDMIKEYLNLMQKRYEKLEYEMIFIENLSNYKVLRLILQPLVENAIIHGVKQKDRPINVRIRGWIDTDALLIEIVDNGIGMGRETLDKVRAMLAGPGNDNPGEAHISLGLKNVHDRLQLKFGVDYGLQIESAKGRGTTVLVRLPLLQ